MSPARASRVAARLPATPDPTMTMSADQGIGQAIGRGGRDHAPKGPAQVPGAGMPSAAHISAPVCVASATLAADHVDARVPPLDDGAFEREVRRREIGCQVPCASRGEQRGRSRRPRSAH